MSVTLGPNPYVVGEIPPPLTYQFLDSSGAPIDLSSAYTAEFTWRERDGLPGGGSASVSNPVNGEVTYTWTGLEFATAGRYTAYFWVGNLTNRLASVEINFTVQIPVGPVPQI
jgi:hypothetical protein